MFPTWIIFGLSSVVLAVFGALFDKYLLERYFGEHEDEYAGPGALLIFSSLFSVLIVLGILFFSYSSINFNIPSAVPAIVAGVLNGAWILCYLHAIHRTDLSRTVPLMQTIPIFGLLIGFFILGEVLTMPQIIAALIIVLGAIVLVREPERGLLAIDRTTIGLTFSAALLTALSQAIYKYAAVSTNYSTAIFWLWLGFVLMGVFLYLFATSYRMQFNEMVRVRFVQIISTNSLNEIFDNLAELLFFAAVIVGPLALVQSLGAYEPLLIFIFSILFTKLYPQYFDEVVTKTALLNKIAGILIITIGSVILYSVL